MPLKHVQVPLEVLTHFPLATVIDSSGIIVWVPPRNDIVPSLSLDKNILDLIPDLILEKLITEVVWSFAAVDGTSYLIHSYPLENKQGTVLYFELVETRTVSMLFENSYEGFVFVDKDGIIRAINETLAHYLKVPKEKLIGQHFDKFKIDRELHRIIETQKPDLLSVFLTWGKNGLASRHPVYSKGKFVGVYGRYFSIDGRDLQENTFGEGYADLLEGLQVNTLAQAMVELNTYKNEFYEKNTTRVGVENIIGNSPEIAQLKKKTVMVGRSPSAILLTGESGTGKELFAKAIHFHSDRSNYPFVKVNCAAIPDNLLESELFGYVDGAFTGARKGGKMGKFELANKGIIFLDEIGDMPLSMQAKLLRVLQENEIERLGAEKEISIDVRVISATNKDLHSMVLEGTFRADLYYRLNVINFHIPPLRQRKDDLPELIDYFIKTLNEKLHRNIRGVSPQAMNQLVNYDWPGNIRELVNALEAAMNFCRSDFLGIQDLPHFFHSDYLGEAPEEDLQSTMEQVKKSEVIAALEKSEGKKKIAASILGVSKSTLYRLMKKYDLMKSES